MGLRWCHCCGGAEITLIYLKGQSDGPYARCDVRLIGQPREDNNA